jgi:hypothetical protein
MAQVILPYLKQTQRLLHDAKQDTLDTGDLVDYVNTARGQVAGEGECIRVVGTLPTVVGNRVYNFSDINISAPGIGGVIHVRLINYLVGQGAQFIEPHGFEWFNLYYLNNPVPDSGPPTEWAQYKQGSAGTGTNSTASGSFILNPIPDFAYSLVLDCVCYPSALDFSSTNETIPYLWTDAVPYFAAYLAFLSYGVRQDDAKRMFNLYTTFMQRARQFSNPSTNTHLYQQSQDPAVINKLGVVNRATGNGAG